MKICLIGACNIGSVLVRKLVTAGHSVNIANSRSPESLREIAEKTGATAMTVRDATQGVEIVILSVLFNSIPLRQWLLSGLPGEVVVADISNYFPYRDRPIAAVDGGEVESLGVSEQFDRPVIKAWDNALAATTNHAGVLHRTRRRRIRRSARYRDRARASKQRDVIMKEFSSRGDQPTTADIVRLNRNIGA